MAAGKFTVYWVQFGWILLKAGDTDTRRPTLLWKAICQMMVRYLNTNRTLALKYLGDKIIPSLSLGSDLQPSRTSKLAWISFHGGRPTLLKVPMRNMGTRFRLKFL